MLAPVWARAIRLTATNATQRNVRKKLFIIAPLEIVFSTRPKKGTRGHTSPLECAPEQEFFRRAGDHDRFQASRQKKCESLDRTAVKCAWKRPGAAYWPRRYAKLANAIAAGREFRSDPAMTLAPGCTCLSEPHGFFSNKLIDEYLRTT